MIESEIAEEALNDFEKSCRRAGLGNDELVSALDELIEQAHARRNELVAGHQEDDEDY